MSTLWYEKRCSEVHTVEDNPEWYELLKGRVARAHITHAPGQQFIESIDQFPVNYFDLVVVDGNLDRFACFQQAERHVKSGGLIVVDDTDKGQMVYSHITKLDQLLSSTNRYEVHRFVGWVPAAFWVKETTICRKV
jgi:predicted O-methyltransferase YrrM